MHMRENTLIKKHYLYATQITKPLSTSEGVQMSFLNGTADRLPKCSPFISVSTIPNM
jgi:hypothetical protein